MKNMPFGIALLLAAGMSTPAISANLTESGIGETIGVTCYGCHGYNGVSQGAVPSLKGHKDVAQALKDFKSGKRSGTIMDRIAKGYSDSDIEAVGNYFAAMK